MTNSVVVTGASRGLGICLVERFIQEGWIVVAARRKSSPRLDAVRRSAPERLIEVTLDVTIREEILAAANQVTSRLGSIDVVINNAAILPEEGRGSVETMNVEVGLRVFDVNTLGPLRVIQAFLPLLGKGERRLIINVSSEAGSVADCWRKDEHHYCMSKAALNMQSMILKNYLGPLGFEVLAVHPGWMRTDMGGPNADIEPEQAAAGLFALAQQRRQPEEGMYIDYQGKPLRW